MKLFITGGAGFIGANFILYWIKNHQDDEIFNFDKLTYAGNLENLKSVEKNAHYIFKKGDITNPQEVSKAIEGADVVVHFAAESHVDRSIMSPSDFVETNVAGTQVLLDAALQNKVKRFHHVSTDEVFGALNLDSKKKFSEGTAYNPHSPYSASKAGSDHLVRAYADTFGLPVTISNSSNNFGPFQFPEKFIPLVVTNALENKKIPVYGDGLYVRDWLYVEDHCRAIEKVVLDGKIGETYCIGGLRPGQNDINNMEVVKKILKLLNKDESLIEFVKDRPGHDRRYAIDWSKIKSDLDWEPLFDFDEWLGKTVDWYKENENWWKAVKDGSYKEYYDKQYMRE